MKVPNQIEPVAVRDVTLQDKSGEVNVTLWQSTATLPLVSGNQIIVKDATLNYSSFYKDHTVTVNDIENIEVC